MKLGWSYGPDAAERDAESGYPSVDKFSKDDHDFAKSFIDPTSGRTKTPFEVSEDKAAEV